MQRIFKHGDIQNISLTPDKELNILIILNAFLRHHIQEKWSRLLADPVLINVLEWIEGEATSSRCSWSFCASHPVEPVVTYCRDCGKALCERCRSLGGLDTAGTCPHSACCELTAAAHSGRAQLEHDQQVPYFLLLVVVVVVGLVFSNHNNTQDTVYVTWWRH